MQLWGAWRPDVVAPNVPFAQLADSVLPMQGAVGPYGNALVGYGPFPQLVSPTGATALSGAPRGSISVILDAGDNQVFYATSSTIEQLTSTYTFSAVDTGRSVTAGDDVSFCKFGSFLLNTDTTDGFKAYNVETPAGNNAVAGAPTARFIFSCNNIVFALDCNGNNRRMQSSGVGDYTAWTSLGADGKTFEDGGNLICGVDLKNGNAIIFQSDAQRLIQFGNAVSPALYSITKAADGRGSVGQRSVVSFDGQVFFLASDGFYKFDLSSGNTPIGAEKVNRWFLSQIDTQFLSQVEGAIDPKNKVVYWAYQSINSTSTTVFDKMICYDWQLNEWFTVTVNLTSLARLATPGYTLEGMDVFGTLNGMTQIPLNDRFWQGGAPILTALDDNYTFSTFSGSPMAATLRGATVNAGVNSLVTEVTPISDDSASTISVGVQRSLSDPVTWKTAVGRNRAGRCPVRASGLSLTFQENHAAGSTWTFSNGVDYPQTAASGPV